MARKKSTRNPNGRSSTISEKTGCWHGRVTMGLKDDGTPDRWHVKRKGDGAYDAVVEAVQQLENGSERRENRVRAPRSKSQTVADWLTYWLNDVVRPEHPLQDLRGVRGRHPQPPGTAYRRAQAGEDSA